MSKPLTQIVTYDKYAPICVSGFSLLFISIAHFLIKHISSIAPNFVRAALFNRRVRLCTLGGFTKRLFLVMHRFGAVYKCAKSLG